MRDESKNKWKVPRFWRVTFKLRPEEECKSQHVMSGAGTFQKQEVTCHKSPVMKDLIIF